MFGSQTVIPLYECLIKEGIVRMADKRLGIEVAGLRQSIWRSLGQGMGDLALEDQKPDSETATDIVRWIETDVMIVDPVTKIMEPVKLVQALDSNIWDCKQPIESLHKKPTTQLQRKKILPEDDAKSADA